MAGNSRSSTIRRTLGTFFTVSAALVGALVAPLSAQAAVPVATAVSQILADTNALRAAGGLAPLVESTSIDTVAQNWSAQMSASGSFIHNPNYTTQIPAGWTGAAENIASGYTYTTVVEGWHQSPGHYANIMGDYNAIGIGYYDLNGQTYFTEDFGKYASVPNPAPPVTTSAVGSASAAPQPVVSGNAILDSRTGKAWTAHAVNWPSFEYACQQGWGNSADGATAAAAAAMVSWGITAVRIPLNQDCWLGVDGSPKSPITTSGYQAALAAWVTTLNSAGLVAILDLHWTAPAGSVADGQRAMPDAQSVTFWSQVSAAYKSSPSVLFETFNEPYSRGSYTVSWSCWKNGGCQVPSSNDQSALGTSTYTAHGQAEIVAAIRATGATQPILLDGLNYANDLTGWLANKPNDPQLIASWHNYPGQGCSDTTCWGSQILPVAASVPVIATEFGMTNSDPTFFNSFMTWADAHGIGYAPWAWWVTDSSDDAAANLYSLIADLINFTPRAPEGTAYSAHLAALGASTPPPPPVAPPTGSLVKSPNNAAIYYVDGARKIPVSSFDVAAQFGAIGYSVYPDSTLTTLATASSPLTIAVTCGSTTLIAGGGQLYPLSSGSAGLSTTTLSTATCSALPRAAAISGQPFLRSADGAISLIQSGLRRPVWSMAAITAITGSSILPTWIPTTPAAAASLPTGGAILGPGQLAKSATSDAVYFIDGLTQKIQISSFDIAAQYGSTGYSIVDSATLNAYATTPGILSIAASCGGSTYLAGSGKLWPVTSAALGSALPITALSAAGCAATPIVSGSAATNLYVRTADGAISIVSQGKLRHVASLAALSAFNGGSLPSWIQTSADGLAGVPPGPTLLTPNQLVKSATSDAVYFIDGLAQKIQISSFDIAAQYGSSGYSVVDDTTLTAYATTPGILGIVITCNGETDIVGSGQRHPASASSAVGLATNALSAASCSAVPTGSTVLGTAFVRDATGRISAIESGKTRAVTSIEALLRYDGGGWPTWVDTSAAGIAALPAGTDIR